MQRLQRIGREPGEASNSTGVNPFPDRAHPLGMGRKCSWALNCGGTRLLICPRANKRAGTVFLAPSRQDLPRCLLHGNLLPEYHERMPFQSHSQHPTIRLSADIYADPATAYFVTACTCAGQPLFGDAAMATEVVDTLTWLRATRRCQIYAYCVMPNHIHLLLTIAHGDSLSECMRVFKKVSEIRLRGMGVEPRVWQRRFFDRVLREKDSGIDAVEYILNNPVRAGLVDDASIYVYSGTPDPIDAAYGA